jgi:hypothetical protein
MKISENFLIQNGFEKKQADETYFENVLNSSEPSMTVYVYADMVCMQIGGSGSEKSLSIENENQLSQFIINLQSVLQ